MILPLLKPAIATVVIIKGIAVYNDFYIPFLYMPSHGSRRHLDVLVPVQGPVRRAVGRSSPPAPSSSSSRRCSSFLLLQRFIYNGFTSGATK